jgi:GNAT superfamily N-acetyltransferase
MLEAYEQAPDAFTSTAQERRSEPMSWWVKRIGSETGDSQAFGAWEERELLGTVAIEFSAKPKTRHSALVLGMYVKPAFRGKGVGALLINAALQAARSRREIRMVRLRLTEGNEAAMRLYRSAGFQVWGVEPAAIFTSAGFKGKVHMAKVLSGEGAAA